MSASVSQISVVFRLLGVFVLILVVALVFHLVPSSPSADSFTETGDPHPLAPIEGGTTAHFEIPHILHHTFASEMVYENYRPMISSCLKLNPNWTYYLWRDSDARTLISLHYPQYMKTYMRFNDNLQRSDAIRYIILHRFGGIYLDMDVECVRPFHPALTRQAAFLDQERVEQTRIAWGRQFSAMNSLMGSVPGHKFFQAMSDRVLLRKLPGDAYSSTGPNVLTQVFQRFRNSPAIWNWPVHLLPPSVASPLMDPNRNWRQLCRYARYGWGSRGCRMLRAKKWRMDDRNGGTVAVHRFLHLGYGFAVRQRKSLFNLTKEFGSARVNFYLRRPV